MAVRDKAIQAMSEAEWVHGPSAPVPFAAALDGLVGFIRDNLLDLADAAQDTKNGSVLTEAGWAFSFAVLVELLEKGADDGQSA